MAEPTQLNSFTQWIPIMGALGGALITGLTAFGMNLVNKRSEERKHKIQVMVQAAVENWKISYDHAKIQQKNGYKTEVQPLDVFLIHQIKLTEALTDSELTINNLPKKLQYVKDFTSVALDWYEKQNK